MATYFAFPAPEQLHLDANRLLDAFAQNTREPQDQLLIKVANSFADAVIQQLILNLVHNMDGDSMAAKVMDTFAGFLRGTVHMLVKQTLSKKSNDELRPLVGFIEHRRIKRVVDGVESDYIAFPMPVDLATRFDKIFHHVRKGDIESQKQPLTEAMVDFSELALFHFYKEPTDLIKLGFIARKAVDIGHSTIDGGSHKAIKQSMPHLKDQEIIDFVEYFSGMLIEI